MHFIQLLGGNGSSKSTCLGYIIENDPVVKKHQGYTRLKSGLILLGRYGTTEDGRSSGGAEAMGDIDCLKETILALEKHLPKKTPVLMEGQIAVSQPIAQWMHENLKTISVIYLHCNPEKAHDRVRRRMKKPDTWESYAVKQSHRGRNPNVLTLHRQNRPKMDIREFNVDTPAWFDKPDKAYHEKLFKKNPDKIVTAPKKVIIRWVAEQVYDLAGMKIPSWARQVTLAGKEK